MSVGIFRAFSGAEFVRFVIEIIEFAHNFALFGMFSVRDACASSAKHAQGVVSSVPQHLKQFFVSFLIVRRVAHRQLAQKSMKIARFSIAFGAIFACDTHAASAKWNQKRPMCFEALL